MSDCYPDNPCTNYPDAVADWCPQCRSGIDPTLVEITSKAGLWAVGLVVGAGIGGITIQDPSVLAGNPAPTFFFKWQDVAILRGAK